MITVVIIMALGILTGIFLSSKTKILKINNYLTTATIFLLLFLLGVNVGLNQNVFDNLHSLGIQALLLTIGALIGSIALSSLTYYFLFKEHPKP